MRPFPVPVLVPIPVSVSIPLEKGTLIPWETILLGSRGMSIPLEASLARSLLHLQMFLEIGLHVTIALVGLLSVFVVSTVAQICRQTWTKTVSVALGQSG